MYGDWILLTACRLFCCGQILLVSIYQILLLSIVKFCCCCLSWAEGFSVLLVRPFQVRQVEAEGSWGILCEDVLLLRETNYWRVFFNVRCCLLWLFGLNPLLCCNQRHYWIPQWEYSALWGRHNSAWPREDSCRTLLSNDSSVKLLELFLDPKLTWDDHITQLCKRLSKVLFLLKKLERLVTE